MFNEKRYERKNWKGVLHTTWNPLGPGVIRIHMIPAKFHPFRNIPSIVILNGQDILPINESWAILLSEFIKNVNEYGGHEMSDEDLNKALEKTYEGMQEVYRKVPKERFARDLGVIIDTFEDVIHRRVPEEPIGLMSIGDYAPYMKAPHRMDLMVSAMEKEGQWHCNQKCLHCYAADQPLSNTEEMSTEDWKKVLKKLRKIGVPQVTFTGGEPTLREDLCQLVYEARWFVTRLNTNGVLMTKELAKGLMDAELDSVQITFYSHDEEVHNRLVGAGNYKQTVEGIKNALEAGLNVSINTPLCSLNKDYGKTLDFLHGLGIEYVTCSGLIITGNATKQDSVETQLSNDEMVAVLKEATDYCYSCGMEINFTSPGWVSEQTLCELDLDRPSCGACLSNMAITPDGQVIPCQSWLTDDGLGDFLKEDWKTIWDKPVCKDHRDYSARMEGRCPLRKQGE